MNADSAWTHLMRAAECDTTDGNPWTGIWGEAMRRGDTVLEVRALRRMVESKFLAPSVLAYGRWFLQGLRRRSWIGYEMVVATAFHYAAILRAAGRRPEAARIEAWTRDFGRRAGLSSHTIAQLRQFALNG